MRICVLAALGRLAALLLLSAPARCVQAVRPSVWATAAHVRAPVRSRSAYRAHTSNAVLGRSLLALGSGLVGLSAARESARAVVTGRQLMVDGAPFLVRGICYSPIPINESVYFAPYVGRQALPLKR